MSKGEAPDPAPDPKLEQFGRLVEEARKRQRLTMAQLADLAKISEATVSRIKSGTAGLDSVIAVRRALNARGESLPVVTLGDETSSDDSGDDAAVWSRLGQQLRAVDDREYRKAVASIREFLRAHRLVSQGIRLISDPLPLNPDDDHQ